MKGFIRFLFMRMYQEELIEIANILRKPMVAAPTNATASDFAAGLSECGAKVGAIMVLEKLDLLA